MPPVVVAEPVTVASVSVRQGLFTCSDQVSDLLGQAVSVGPLAPWNHEVEETFGS